MGDSSQPKGTWRVNLAASRVIEHGQKPARVQHTPPVLPAGSRITPPPASTIKR